MGEIAIRGHNVMKGYWNRPEATAAAIVDGWFHSGDLATRDEDGFYFIVDRKKDLIIRGGFNIYPREIEEVLYATPGGARGRGGGRAAPHASARRSPRRSPCARPTPSAPRSSATTSRPAWRRTSTPATSGSWESLPKGPTGKILKRDIQVPEDVTAPAG